MWGKAWKNHVGVKLAEYVLLHVYSLNVQTKEQQLQTELSACNYNSLKNAITAIAPYLLSSFTAVLLGSSFIQHFKIPQRTEPKECSRADKEELD